MIWFGYFYSVFSIMFSSRDGSITYWLYVWKKNLENIQFQHTMHWTLPHGGISVSMTTMYEYWLKKVHNRQLFPKRTWFADVYIFFLDYKLRFQSKNYICLLEHCCFLEHSFWLWSKSKQSCASVRAWGFVCAHVEGVYFDILKLDMWYINSTEQSSTQQYTTEQNSSNEFSR